MSVRRTQGILWEQDGFRLTATGMRVNGQPTLGEWSNALRSISRSQSAVQWALGDLLAYSDTRDWDDAAIEQIMDATGYKRGTLMNYKLVSKAFPIDRRRTDLPWSHHALVVSLPTEAGDALLAASAEQAWDWEQLREQARSARRERERVEQEFPEGTYGLLYAEVPWRSTDRDDTLETDAIAAIAPRVQAITAPDAVLYLEASNVQLEDAVNVLRGWGFTLRGHHVLVQKVTERTSEYMRERHALLLLGTRGRPIPPDNPPDSVLQADTEAVTDVLDRAYGGIPRVVLFATQPREGWVTWQHSIAVEQGPVRGLLIRRDEEQPEPEPEHLPV